MVTKVTQQASQEELDAKVRAKVIEVLEEFKGRGVTCLVLFAAHGDHVSYRYVGKPVEVFTVANMGHNHVMQAFELDAEKPLPGQRVN